MAAVKMNVLHWHLYDNEGFRSRASVSQAAGSRIRRAVLHAGRIRELVAYAHDRGIRVVPEFEMRPQPLIVAGYPALASGPGPTRSSPEQLTLSWIQRGTNLQVHRSVHCGDGQALPDDYFILARRGRRHQWTPTEIQEFIHAHGMKNNQDLQAFFNQRLQTILGKHHRS